ncbi:MFS transporter [Sphaerisporangium rubeum]|uniref:MFS family permease n=2 Tax=Sphaerisporangium rubeum TaxID=321317 RepID=A0A7X0IK21_9ACTN|nr:MFS transporter [Sphaerisporangium rubeum]MBB6476611.1 MFS family permease [Sphaerisporangium rubeum]
MVAAGSPEGAASAERDAVEEAGLAEVQATEIRGADPVGETRGGMFRSLRNHNYRLFVSGSVISNVGTWMQRTAQDWLVLELTHGSSAALGVTTALQFLPIGLFGLWGGVLADRYSKRHLLMAAQSLLGVLSLTLGLLTVTGHAQVWHVYVMAFLLGTVSCVEVPTRQSFVVEMVGRRDLPNAIALNSSTFNLARVVGPAVAGVLIYALGGTGPIFLLNAASFAAVIAGLSVMRKSELRTPERVARAKGQLREGLRYVWRSPELLMPILLVAFVAMFATSFTMSIAVMAKQVFGQGASSFGVASSAFAVGALGGALLAARRIRPSRRFLIGGAIAFGVFEVVAGLAPGYVSFLFLLVPAGVAMITTNTTANSTVQLAASPEMRGRVMGIYVLVFTGGAPIGAPLIGWVGELAGPRLGMVICGVMCLVGVGLAMLLTRFAAGRTQGAVVRGVVTSPGGAR